MPPLLDSLKIENYRLFESLHIERLGRVNLLVGKNNSGKSTVLEAVRLYASNDGSLTIQKILQSRDEGGKRERHVTGIISVDFYEAAKRRGAVGQPKISVTSSSRSRSSYSYIAPDGMDRRDAAQLWDRIVLTDSEVDVIQALRIISSDIERLSFIGESDKDRIPMVKLASEARPVPLRTLGDGVNRMLGIALACAHAAGGFLLVDEIENGIHYSVQPQMWELIFRIAARMDVQVFATTHSWDCIEAFQHAAANDYGEEAALIRLDTRSGKVKPTIFSEKELAIATRERIEIR
jgi:AAA15 family ATPase/GTPase